MSFSQNTNKEIIAKIEVEKFTDALNIRGTVFSKTDLIKSLRYDMFIYRKNPETNNTVKSKNSGRFVLNPNQKKILSKADINQNTQDKITAVILVYNEDDKLVAKDRQVILNDDENKKETTIKNTVIKEEDYSVFRGIVTENTKTKPGRDFYIQFYSYYQLEKINGREVVEINEKFSFGRSTIMEVKVGKSIVHSFFVQPKRDFIIQQSQTAILQVSRYFSKLERQKNYIKQY